MRFHFRHSLALVASCLATLFGLVPFAAFGEGAGQVIEEVIVTGSYIRGTAEDAALPVDVIDALELAQRGSPTALDIIRAMPYVTSMVGESNQFGPNQGTIGTGNVNLRGLGGMRTLVLMNGRRTTYTPAEGPAGVDTNLLPIAAIGRVEVLKDGAAATYGSDAIAGVVNFIMRRDLQGLEVAGEFRSISGNDGDYTGSLNWGWVGEDSNILVSYARQHRSELKSTDRSWAVEPYIVNNTGWSAFSTPGVHRLRDATGATVAGGGFVPDTNCGAIGGYVDGSKICRFSFVPFDNLIEKTEQQQFYVELNTEIADGVEFHMEGLYSDTDLPQYRTSPSYPPTSGPNGPGAFQFGVFNDAAGPSKFSNNPGALTFLQQAGVNQAAIDTTEEVNLYLWRPNGWGGVPNLTGGNGGQLNRNTFNMGRVSAGLKGTFSQGWSEGIGWDVAVTYSKSDHSRSGVDVQINRLQQALQGLGGDNCNAIPYGQPGSTCLFFNPFSNAIPRGAINGVTNPGFVSANANTDEVQQWIISRNAVKQEQSLLVGDLVFNGEISGFELPGGAIGWAVGTQYRKIEYQTKPTNNLWNADITPCATPGDTSCSLPTGPFIFLGQFTVQAVGDDVVSLFAETALPILDNLDMQIAVRYEDYGGLTGDTTDPKFSLHWEATEYLAFRGSVGSTFRGPTPVNKSLEATGLQPISATASQYRSIDFTGNPNLVPEKADTSSFGVIVKFGGFRGIVDYWNYTFEDQIVTVPFNPIANAVGNGPGDGNQLANCSHALRGSVIFDQNNTCTQGVTTANQMQRIASPVVNGPGIETAGFDVSLSYDFEEVLNGTFNVGFDATYIDKYKVDDFIADGGVLISKGFDAVGFVNEERSPGYVPGTITQLKAIGHANFNIDNWNFRYEVRFLDGVDDERANPTVTTTAGVATKITYGDTVDKYYSHNLYVNWQAPWETTLSLSIVNLLDKDPPDARHQIGYNPYIGDPLGRTIEIGFKKTFGLLN